MGRFGSVLALVVHLSLVCRLMPAKSADSDSYEPSEEVRQIFEKAIELHERCFVLGEESEELIDQYTAEIVIVHTKFTDLYEKLVDITDKAYKTGLDTVKQADLEAVRVCSNLIELDGDLEEAIRATEPIITTYHSLMQTIEDLPDADKETLKDEIDGLKKAMMELSTPTPTTEVTTPTTSTPTTTEPKPTESTDKPEPSKPSTSTEPTKPVEASDEVDEPSTSGKSVSKPSDTTEPSESDDVDECSVSLGEEMDKRVVELRKEMGHLVSFIEQIMSKVDEEWFVSPEVTNIKVKRMIEIFKKITDEYRDIQAIYKDKGLENEELRSNYKYLMAKVDKLSKKVGELPTERPTTKPKPEPEPTTEPESEDKPTEPESVEVEVESDDDEELVYIPKPEHTEPEVVETEQLEDEVDVEDEIEPSQIDEVGSKCEPQVKHDEPDEVKEGDKSSESEDLYREKGDKSDSADEFEKLDEDKVEEEEICVVEESTQTYLELSKSREKEHSEMADQATQTDFEVELPKPEDDKTKDKEHKPKDKKEDKDKPEKPHDRKYLTGTWIVVVTICAIVVVLILAILIFFLCSR